MEVASSRASRAADIKLITAATVGVLLVGGMIAGMIWLATSGGSEDQRICGQLNAGSAVGIRQTLDNGGPVFTTGGAGCGFYLALLDGDIVAYKAYQDDAACTLRLKRDHWECGGNVLADDELEQYDVSIESVDGNDAVFVDLRPPEFSSTTVAVTSTT
jgi:hypothetical protein